MRSTRFVGGAGFALAAALVMWSCAGGGSPSPGPSPTPNPTPAPPSNTVTVNIVGSSGSAAYKPNPVMANAGDQLVFKNDDTRMHRVVLDDGSADLGDLTPGATSRAITVKGSAASNFHCTIHASMVGSINGTSPPMPTPCPDPSAYGC